MPDRPPTYGGNDPKQPSNITGTSLNDSSTSNASGGSKGRPPTMGGNK